MTSLHPRGSPCLRLLPPVDPHPVPAVYRGARLWNNAADPYRRDPLTRLASS